MLTPRSSEFAEKVATAAFLIGHMREQPQTPRIEQLLSHSTWVWQLARRLVDDDEQARDVVQETWVRALRRPPQLGIAETARPWLQTVVRNLAAQLRRTEERRGAREREVARPEAVPPVDRVRAREDARRVVVDAVLALPEPYREAVVLRYFDELTPAAIAARLGVPGSTVRSRLQRAHELLRTRLASQRSDDARSWLAALIPLIPDRAPLGALSLGVVIVNTKLLLLSGAAVVVALIVWLAVTADSVQEHVTGTSAPSNEAATAPDDASASDALAQREEILSEPLDSLANTASARAQPTVRVQVIERASGKPLPGANVLYASVDELGAQVTGNLELTLSERGKQLVADATGEAEFPYYGTAMRVAARSGDLWGQTQATATRPELITLELIRDREIEVQVVDLSGQPVAGVPLVLASVIADGHSTGGWSEFTTNSRGIAAIRHFDLVAPRPNALGELLVELAFPQVVSQGARIDLAALPTEPLRMELPPCGSIRLRLLDDSGQRVTTTYNLMAIGIDRRVALRRPFPIEGGEGVLPFVGLDLQLQLSGFPAQPGMLDAFSTSVRSPVRDGEEVVVEVQVAKSDTLPHGRAIDADSNPMLSQELTFWFHTPEDGSHGKSLTTRTDYGGFFKLDVYPKRYDGKAVELRVVARDHGAGQSLEASASVASADFLRGADLGVLRLLPSPLIASGRVLNELDQPVARATVELLRRAVVTDSQRQLAALGYDANTTEWLPVPLRSATTDDSGAFTIHGVELPGEFTLDAAREGYCDMAQASLETGSTGIVLRLTRAGALSGSVRLPHPSLASVLRVQAWPEGDSDTARSSGARVELDGHFRIDRVWPGPQRICVSMSPRAAELIVIEGVVARAGETVRDPRLTDIELEGLVHLFELEIVGPASEPVGFGSITYRAADSPSDEFFDEVPIRGGRATVLSPERDLELTLHARGFQVREERASPGRTRIALDAGFEMVLSLPEGFVVADEFVIEAQFWRRDASKHDLQRVSLPSAAPLRVALPRAGEWTVEWHLTRRSQAVPRILLSSALLDIGERSPSRELPLEVTQAELDAAVDSLRAKPKR